jgi:Ser/Thr protein kinase RdoA (MazF antagonist)
MCATAVESAPGVQIDADDLTQDYAAAWGYALASLHKAGHDVSFPVVQRFAGLGLLLATDDPLSSAVRSLLTRLGAVPADDRHFGLVHGDFELDNIAWDDGVPTSFDFDEAACSWFAADVAFALRDLQADANGGEARKDMIGAFLSGYRQVRPFDSDDEDSLELFARLNAARAMATIIGVLAADEQPQDHPDLYERLQRFVHRQRAIVLNEVAAP